MIKWVLKIGFYALLIVGFYAVIFAPAAITFLNSIK